MTTLTIGADPEVFVLRKGAFVSGHTFPCGSKDAPRKMEHGSVQVDGLALEFNVLPSRSKVEFVNNTIKVFRELNSLVKSLDPEVSLKAVPTADFGDEYIQSLPEDVRRLGCNPDFSAYTRIENPAPNGQVPFRTGAGHIHIGWTADANPMSPDHFDTCIRLTKELDYFVGLPSLIWDRDHRRRALYGRAGAFRPKPYGMEYRVLSNAWLSNRDLMAQVYDQTLAAVRRAFKSRRKLMHEKYGDYARNMIDTGFTTWNLEDRRIAKEVFQDANR